LVLFIVYLAGGRATGTQTLHQVTASPDTSLRTHGARRLAGEALEARGLDAGNDNLRSNITCAAEEVRYSYGIENAHTRLAAS